MDEDEWETDPDFENNLTEAEQRAFGNKATMEAFNAEMDKTGGSIPGESKPSLAKQPAVPTPPPPTPPEEPAASAKPPTPGKLSAFSPPEPPAAASPPSFAKRTPGKLAFSPPAPAAAPPAAKAHDPLAGAVDHIGEAPRSSPRSGTSKNVGSSKSVLTRTRRASDQGNEELQALFQSLDTDRSGAIGVDELSTALERLRMPMPREKLVAMLQDVDADGNCEIDYAEFVSAVDRVKTQKGTAGSPAAAFTEVVHKGTGALMTQAKDGGIVHSFAEDECAAFCEFINSKFSWDTGLAYLLPLSELTDLFSGCADGVLLCRMINLAVAETIDERVINVQPSNRFLINENLNLAINAAKSIGLTVVNIGASDIIERRPHLVLGLVWQLVKLCLLSKINLKANPNLIRLLEEGETLEFLLKLPPEKLLLRWFNHHLAEAGVSKRATNFGADLKDSELYAYLLQQIDPEKKCSAGTVLQKSDLIQRAGSIAAQGPRLGAEFTIQPADIVSGNEKLNMAFVAALFNACPALEPPKEAEVAALLEELPDDDAGDSREERAFRMWINSLGIDSCPYVTNLFDDLRDGEVILRTMEYVRPRTVDWSRVNKAPTMVFKRTENLNYAVELAKKAFAFSLVGVQGKDIVDGNKKLTLALIWQLMRFHLLAFLATLRTKSGSGSMSDAEMVEWANGQVKGSGSVSTMKDFHDKSLGSGLFLIDLLAAVEPRCVDRALVTPGVTDEERKLNAKYAISSARKIGCSLFLLWEDIAEVRPKMILSFIATVMSHSMLGKVLTTPRGTPAD